MTILFNPDNSLEDAIEKLHGRKGTCVQATLRCECCGTTVFVSTGTTVTDALYCVVRDARSLYKDEFQDVRLVVSIEIMHRGL